MGIVQASKKSAIYLYDMVASRINSISGITHKFLAALTAWIPPPI